MNRRVRQNRLLCVLLLGVVAPAMGKGNGALLAGQAMPSLATYAIQSVRELHSVGTPTIVVQSELDHLIGADGGGACPISAALIAMQTLRAMVGSPLESHPHRFALKLFRDRPELKEGRISNERFENLLRAVGDLGKEFNVEVRTTSARNSKHTRDGPYWSETDGPDLSLHPGELKVLSYTVTTANGVWRGRHFVLLKSIDGQRIRVLDPTRPFKDYQYAIEYEGNDTAPKSVAYLRNGARGDVYELNTVFTVRASDLGQAAGCLPTLTIDSVKTQIDLLADALQAEGRLDSPREWRRRGASFGLPGLDLPSEVGGSGWTSEKTLEVFRHAGRYNLNLRDVVGGAHGRPIATMHSDFAKAALRDLVDGKAYIAVAITEQGAGTHTKNIQSQAESDGDGFRLSGSKLWNARLRQATHVVLYTRAASNKSGNQTAFLLPIDHPGLKVVERYAHGLTGNSFGGLKFNDMYVGREHLIGEDGEGGDLFERHFLYWRLMQAAAAIGCGERALEVMANRIRERHAFGGPIGRFTHLQQPIGEQLTKLRMALALSREAARLFDQENYDAAEPLVNGVKAEGVEVALAACDAAMRAHGALGYSRDIDVGDRVRDLMGLRIADGTTDVMRMLVVREAFGRDLWQMAIESGAGEAADPKAP